MEGARGQENIHELGAHSTMREGRGRTEREGKGQKSSIKRWDEGLIKQQKSQAEAKRGKKLENTPFGGRIFPKRRKKYPI